MEKIKKAFISIFSILLVVVVAFGIARGITGAWNPKDWGKSKDSSSTERDDSENKDDMADVGDTGDTSDGGDDKDDSGDGTSTAPVVPDPPAPTTNPNIISEYTEVTFTECFYDLGRWFVQTPEKFDIFTEAGYGRAYYGADELCGGTLSFGLKLETDTEITFETGISLYMSLWLDKVEVGEHAVDSTYPSCIGVRIDGYTCWADRIVDDPIGYRLDMLLSAGRHTIRKVDTCVLSSLTLMQYS